MRLNGITPRSGLPKCRTQYRQANLSSSVCLPSTSSCFGAYESGRSPLLKANPFRERHLRQIRDEVRPFAGRALVAVETGQLTAEGQVPGRIDAHHRELHGTALVVRFGT